MGVGTLTQYAFGAVLVPLLVYVGVSFRRRHWLRRVGMCLAIVALALAPWMVRNWRVSRTWFGLWKVAVYEGVRPSLYTTLKPGDLQRGYGLDVEMRWRPMARKTLVNLRALYETGVKDIGSGYLIAFFLASLLHRFRREEIFRLRRFVFWSLLAGVLWLSVAGPPKQNFLTIFLPLIILYGVAFFYVIFERLQFRTRLLRRGMIGLFVLMNLLPFVFTVLPPWETPPYPPYDGGVAGAVGSAFREEEVLASDIPWAVAWYGDRATVWLPLDQQDYMTINDDVHVIAGLYLTQQFVLDQDPVEIALVRYPFWRQMYLQPPAGFPLQVLRALTPDGQQVLLSDRVR